MDNKAVTNNKLNIDIRKLVYCIWGGTGSSYAIIFPIVEMIGFGVALKV